MVRTLALAVVALAGGAAPAADGLGRRDDLDRYRNYYLPADAADPKDGAVRVTFLGTTTLLFDDGETQLLIDGFLTRPSMLRVGARKLETDPKVVDAALKRAKVTRLKAVFVAHTHYDHALDAAYVARTNRAKLHGSASTLNVGRGDEVPPADRVPFVPGRDVRVGRFTVVVLASKHTPPIKGVNNDLGETIDQPLRQPAWAHDYKEGGSFDFLVRHDRGAVLVKPSTNSVEGALDKVRADALFLGTALLARQSREFQAAYYDQTVRKVRPKLVVPIHWDNFFKPLDDGLEFPPRVIDDGPEAFDFLIGRLKADKVQFGVLLGYQGVTLFGPAKK